MPATLSYPEVQSWEGPVQDEDIRSYEYPRNLDLKPGSPLHDRLVNAIVEYAQRSRRAMNYRFPEWRRMDRVLRAYVNPDIYYKNKDSKQLWEGICYDEKSRPIIVMPVSYSILQTLQTYMSAAFFQQPLFMYEGRGPEDTLGALLLQHYIEQQVEYRAIELAMLTQWRDGFSYGLGAVTAVWLREYGYRTVLKEEGVEDDDLGLFLGTGRMRRSREYQLLWEGNDLQNIDPYNYFPDPSVSAHEIQDGDYWGWLDETTYLSLLSDEMQPGSILFNVEWLKKHSGLSQFGSEENARRGGSEDRRTKSGQHMHRDNKRVDVIWMYVNLVPNDWELGNGRRPEKWLFGVAGDKVLITARPTRQDHGKFPGAVFAPDFDGYSAFPTSRLGVVADQQAFVDFLYTSHIQNVRASINNTLVYDPYLVDSRDVNRPEPGGRIRMRRAAWGRGNVRDAITQLDIRDVTQQHVQEALLVQDAMHNATAASDIAQGRIAPRTSRISAREVAAVQTGTLSRLELAARIYSLQVMKPVGRMFAQHAVQLASEGTWVKAMGEHARRLQETYGVELQDDRLFVSPSDIIVDYDVKTKDGTIPGSENAGTWLELMEIAQANPEITRNLDWRRVFLHVARQLGARNAEDFMLATPRPVVMDDEAVDQQATAGNLIPMPSGDGL